MMDEREDRLDAMLRDAAQDYNAPGPVPRAQIWERIEAARKADGRTVGRSDNSVVIRRNRVFRLGIGIAALVILGIAIGRVTAPGAPSTAAPGAAPAPIAQAPSGDTGVSTESREPVRGGGVGAPVRGALPNARSENGLPIRLATAEHLTQVETFLTDFSTQDSTADFAGQAQDLLGTTRLLLDSKRVRDARTRKLLEDLELILVQIAALDSTRGEDRGFIADGLARNHLRTRLRNAIPVGPAIRM